MQEIDKHISQLIESQFPQIYREDSPIMVAFVKAYFEFLEQGDNSFAHSKKIPEYRDIDNTIDAFLDNFQNMFLKDFPFVAATDKRFLVKNILDYYRSKGTKQGLQLLFRLMFNEDSDVYYPSIDVLKPSHSEWLTPKYIEVSHSPLTTSYLNQQIYGSNSNARAFVEAIVRKSINGKLIDVLYLSSIEGTFQKEDVITLADGVIENAPVVVGSLSGIVITNGGQNFINGDIFEISGTEGKQGKAKVTSTVNGTGRVDFSLIDGGSGYTLSSNTGTETYVATAMLKVASNDGNTLGIFEEIKQPIETLTIASANDLFAVANVGEYVVGVNASASPANSANHLVTGVVLERSFANSDVVLKVQTSNATSTFLPQKRLYSTDTFTNFEENEIIDEEATYVITSPTNNSNTVADGDIVEQYTNSGNSTLIVYSSYARGTISNTVANSTLTTITLSPSFGTFVDSSNAIITFANNDTLEIALNSATLSGTEGARGTISDIEANDSFIVVNSTFGAFDANNIVRGRKSHQQATLTSIQDTGVSRVFGSESSYNSNTNVLTLTANNDANGILSSVADTSANGIVVGQNTSYIGIFGNTQAFVFSNNITANSLYVTTTRLDDPAPSADLIFKLESIGTGTSANFVPGSLENTEGPFSFYVDTIGGNNVSNVPFQSIVIDGSNSGIGFLKTIEVHEVVVGLGATPNASFTVSSNVEFSTNATSNDVIATAKISSIGANSITVANSEGLYVATNVMKQRDGNNTVIASDDIIDVTGVGSGFTNGDSIIITNGGRGNGDPIINASRTITTDATGGIVSTNTVLFGLGYFQAPTLNANTGIINEATSLSAVVENGYGFQELPSGGFYNTIDSLLAQNSFTLGTISSLASVNPGSAYNVDPFVKVYNRFIAPFDRRDLVINIENKTGDFAVGQVVSQDLGGSSFARGLVKSSTVNKIVLKRISFNQFFNLTNAISSATASADIVSIEDDLSSSPMGDNAVLTANVITANGIISALTIIDSGFGYANNEVLTLSNSNTNIIVSGTANVATQGIGQGYWKTRSSHLNENKFLHDNNYYQEFSYDVISGLSIDKYRDMLKNIFHVAGTKLFGTVRQVAVSNTNPVEKITSIQVTANNVSANTIER